MIKESEVGNNIGQPSWQDIVDDIERRFSSRYDQVEFGENQALARMARLDIVMLNQGLNSLRSTSGSLIGKVILVAGVGTGREVVELVKQGVRVVGIDATAEYVELTKQNLGPMGRHRAVILQSPWEDYIPTEKMDAVSSLFGVLNHVEQWKTALQNTAQTLKPGGMFIFSVYGSNDARVFDMVQNDKLPYKPSILQIRTDGGILLGEEATEVLPTVFPTVNQIIQALEKNGLKTERIKGFLNFAALFPKPPTEKNIEELKEILWEVEPECARLIENISDPTIILDTLISYDERISEDPDRLSEFAYIGFVARKD